MIDIDNPPLAVLIPILIVFIFPFIYSFFIDKYNKGAPPIRDDE